MAVHVQDDLEALEHSDDDYFDWAYVDSSHTYEHARKELDMLLDQVKDDGVISGDAWRPDPSHRHHGVFGAVDEFLERHGFELLYASEDDLQWFIGKS